MSLKLKGKYYYVVFRDLRGKMNSRSLKTSNYENAKKLHDIYMNNLRIARQQRTMLQDFPMLNTILPNVEISHIRPQTHRKGIKLVDMLQCASKRRKMSIEHIRAINKLIERVPYKYASEITPQVALQYLERYYNFGNGKTYNNVKSCLNTVFRCCLVEANLSASPFDSIINRQVTDVESHRNLSDEEIARVMKILPIELQILTMLSRWTGQRLETCARMTPEMFDFERKVFIIDPGKTKRFKKWVCCPILPELEKFIKPILLRCKNKEVPIVEHFAKKANNHYSESFTEKLQMAGILDSDAGKASFHSLRGSAITWFKEHGVNGETLRSITGHESSSVEDIYARDIATISHIAKSFF